jgi:hypothetical protein
MTVSVIAKRHSSHCEKTLPFLPRAKWRPEVSRLGRGGAEGNNCGRAPDARRKTRYLAHVHAGDTAARRARHQLRDALLKPGDLDLDFLEARAGRGAPADGICLLSGVDRVFSRTQILVSG